MSKLLIVGALAFDAIETPYGKTKKTIGGPANYIGLSASQFDIESAIVSIVGEDYPKESLQALQERNIDISQVQIKQGEKTFFWKARYHNDMNSRDTLETQLNVLEGFTPIVPENFKASEVVMLGNLHPKTQLEVLSQLEAKPALVVLDTMNYWMNHTWDDLLKVIEKTDVLVINDEEARQLSKEYSLVKSARKIMEMGVPFVVIKKGEHGALLFHKDKIFSAPALPLEEVLDPTGAGDSFAGGFVGYLTKTEDHSFDNMKNAVIYASNIASFCVEKFGTERMMELTKDEVLKRLLQFKELTQFEIKIA